MEKRRGRNTAVVLAAGMGSRMKSSVAKQFLPLGGKPLIYYALRVMEDSKVIDDVILVTGEDDMEKMRMEVVEKYSFRKVRVIIPGGSERCFSVTNAMRWIAGTSSLARHGAEYLENAVWKRDEEGRERYVFIHDGARPFITEEILERTYEAAKENGACVAAMPSKDTVKLSDEEGFAVQTPERKNVWTVQTPQVFERELIVAAYARFEESLAPQALKKAVGQEEPVNGTPGSVTVTDDASVVEKFTDVRVKLVEGSYENLKVTTPEDLAVAEALLVRRSI